MIHILTILIEISCLISALLFLRKDRTRFSFITISYLVTVGLIEIFGLFYVKITHQSNAWIYNIFIIFEASYISFGLYEALLPLTKRALVICSTAFVIFCFTYLVEIFYWDFLKFQTLTITIESVIFVCISLIYFQLLIKQKDSINLKIHPQFWWIAAVLFYYFGSTIYNIFIYFLYAHIPKSYNILVYMMLILNLLLYSIWTYSFLCSSRQQKLSSSLP